MPKETTAFGSMIDYQEAFVAKTKPVLFGHPENLAMFRDDIIKNDTVSPYLGMVLYPERDSRRAIEGTDWGWSYDKNKAFWAGAIDAGRVFELVSDIGHFKKSGTTIDEIFWLQDNGYTFAPNPSNPLHTIATPPVHPEPIKFIKNYNRGYGDESEGTAARLKRLQGIKQQVLQLRSTLTSSSSSSASSSTSSFAPQP